MENKKLNDNYKYKLQYICDDKILTYEFNADVGADGLREHLRDFLCGCSWFESTIENSILNNDEEE